jgi:hypothetical protein
LEAAGDAVGEVDEREVNRLVEQIVEAPGCRG